MVKESHKTDRETNNNWMKKTKTENRKKDSYVATTFCAKCKQPNKTSKWEEEKNNKQTMTNTLMETLE